MPSILNRPSLFLEEKISAFSGKNAPHVDYDYPRKEFCGIALIGEAPGAEEERQGHPFVGRSGQLLDKILAEVQIDRASCLIANVFRMRPPGNKVDHFFLSRRAAKEKNVGLAEQFGAFSSKYCRNDFVHEINHLKTELKKIEPKIIVALGRTPFWAVTGENALLQKVGKPIPCRLLEGVFVIPTYHPSFILRGNWGLQKQWLEHLQTAKKYLL